MSSRPHPSRAQWLRRLAMRRKDRVGFALSGGGPLGALQVGALKALLEHDIHPDLVVGTSVGALNATFVAFEPTVAATHRLEDIWLNLQEGDLFPGGRFRASWARMLVRGNRVFENSGIRKLVRTRIGDASFEDVQIPLGVVATDLDTGFEKLFTSGQLEAPLLASTAMPGVFPPVEIDGHTYIDGGVSNNVPIAPAVSMGARTVYVMDATSHAHQRRPLTRPMDYLLHAFTLARSQRLLVEQVSLADKVRLVMIPPAPLDIFVPFASMEHTAHLIDASYRRTSEFLEGRTEAVVEQPEAGVEVIVPAK